MANSSRKRYKVYQSNGGLRITIPKSIATGMGIEEGAYVKWVVKSENELFMKINDGGDYKIFKGGEQFRVTLPKSLANALGITRGTEIKWIISSDDTLILRRLE